MNREFDIQSPESPPTDPLDRKDPMERKKTLHITTLSITAYCFLRSWFAFLSGKGHSVTLACTATEFLSELEAAGASIHNVPIARSVNPIKDMISLISLWGFIRKGRYDSVHTHTTKAGLLGRLAARLAGVPLIIHTMHDPPHNSARNPILRKLYILMEQIASLWTHHIVTVSYANYEEIKKQKIAPLDKVTVIREGIELSLYDIHVDRAAKRQELSIPSDAKVVGIVARLEAAKGHIYLIDAMPEILQEVPESFFVIVGRGHLREQLEARVQALGVENRVVFTGFREDMLEIMNIFDLFTLPSLWEGLGIVLLEAMAFRLPIVASRVGGITDVVVDDTTGFLVPQKDSKSLALAIITLLKDPDRAKKMGEEGYQRVSKEFRDSVANEKMMELYEKLMNQYHK